MLESLAGNHAVVVLHEVEDLSICGLETRQCLVKILDADSLGVWVEHPGWGAGLLPSVRPARLLLRWTNLAAVLVLGGGELSRAEFGCLAEVPNAPVRPIGFS